MKKKKEKRKKERTVYSLKKLYERSFITLPEWPKPLRGKRVIISGYVKKMKMNNCLRYSHKDYGTKQHK